MIIFIIQYYFKSKFLCVKMSMNFKMAAIKGASSPKINLAVRVNNTPSIGSKSSTKTSTQSTKTSSYSTKTHTHSHHSNQGDEFLCLQCGFRLPTKILPDGRTVKKWEDDICQTCWQANDMISQPSKFGLTQEIISFLGHLKPEDIKYIISPSKVTLSPKDKAAYDFLYSELIGELYYESDRDWMADIQGFINMLETIKADRYFLAMQLHRQLVKPWW